MLRSALALVIACATTTFFGCAAPHADADSEGEVAQSKDALALALLYGTWNGQGGPLLAITFTMEPATTFGGVKGRRFAATVDTGIRCITTPCPSQVDVSGVYRLAHGTELTLLSYDNPSVELAKVLGEYRVKRKGSVLTITSKSDRKNVQTFQEAVAPTATEILDAAKAHAWPTLDPDYVYRTFDSRAEAEAWGSTQSGAEWLAREGETADGSATKFVSGRNDLWSQEFTVDKATLTITVTGEH